ncbi:MAG: RNA polymerase subunit sigma-70 [Ruminococcus sp.]|nr:RNA polymerase subunit sigma-70 [Ruminococcus sp.]MDD6708532.1 RNA polymerase subunit sigma-70 [Ruminococcus sp.]
MNKEQKASIIKMRSDGMAFPEIANQLQLSINTVKSFYRRNAKTKSQLEACMNCGKPIEQTKHKRQKKFCSDKCRNAWWYAHSQSRRPKRLYSHICAYCGTAFESDRAKRKAIDRFIYDLSKREELLTEFDNCLWLTVVETVRVRNDRSLVWKFNTGTECKKNKKKFDIIC